MLFLIALIAGAASAFAFQPFAIGPLMVLAIAVLCELIVRAPSLRRSLLIGWGFGVGQFCVGLNWIATAFTFQAAMPAWLGWIAVVLLSLYLAVYPMLAAALAWTFGRTSRFALVLALAGGWTVTEWLRATIFTGFAWNPVGVTLVDTPLLAASRFVGTYGLSALVVLLGGALWLAWRREVRATAAALLVPVLLTFLPGPTLSDRPMAMPPVRIVQPNIGQQDKWRPGFDAIAGERLANLSLVGPPVTPELVFWPEAAVTEPLQDGRRGAESAVEAERLRATRTLNAGDILLTGGLALQSADGSGLTGATNSVFVMGPLGEALGRYDKAHLVPYGEYLPMRPLLSAIGLSRLAPGDLDFAAGAGPQTIELPRGMGKIGFQLCYEIIFSGQVVDRAHRPDLLFNPSNDAWFGRWGPPQHLAQARLRAAEEALPVIRSTPTGISAFVGPAGELYASLPWQKAGVIRATMPRAAIGLTPFARFGNLIPITVGFLLIAAAIALTYARRYRRT
ncbi:MAG TPA: apolipoprotein N-acyltransferase [Sphingomicrobium sp.]|nr:apolipoprotein N-acyltransferase [Sphingomicrobium sp.]